MNHIICPEAAHAESTLAHKLCSQTYFQHSWYFSGSYKNELNGKVRVLSSLAFEKLQTHFPKWIQHHEFFSSIYIYIYEKPGFGTSGVGRPPIGVYGFVTELILWPQA